MVHGLRVLLLGVWCAGCSAYSIATPRVARPRRASPLLMVDPTQIADLVRSGELVEPSYGIDMYHHLTPEKFISDMAWTTFIAIGGVMGAYVTADTVDTDFEPLPPPPRREEEERE